MALDSIVASLTQPLQGDTGPCGPDMVFSPEFDQLNELRRQDDPTLDQGEWVTELKRADWSAAAKLAEELLSHRTKDLRLAAWWAEAASHVHGFEGLAEHGSAPESLLVTDVVLAEALWTLRSAYQQDKAAQRVAVHSLLGETAFAFEDRDAVAVALDMFERHSCGFSDCLVAAKHRRLGCELTAAVDRSMRKLPDAKLL
jgi:predicted nucleic-acid-binding protein